MLYDVNTKIKHDKRVTEMLDKGFIFPNNIKPYTFEQAKKCYHGNSKLLLQTFYNDITGKNEMQYTTMSVYLYKEDFTDESFAELLDDLDLDGSEVGEEIKLFAVVDKDCLKE